MSLETIETIFHLGNSTQVNDARIEEVSCSSTPESILVSYPAAQTGRDLRRQRLQLNITPNTVILNPFGQSISTCSLRPGMVVNAIFSSITTRSIPPQSNAFLIVGQSGERPSASDVTTTRVLFFNPFTRLLYTGRPNDPNRQMIFVVTRSTSIIDRNGRPGNISLLRPGQRVRITHANFQTASIPPQTTAFRIRIL